MGSFNSRLENYRKPYIPILTTKPLTPWVVNADTPPPPYHLRKLKNTFAIKWIMRISVDTFRKEKGQTFQCKRGPYLLHSQKSIWWVGNWNHRCTKSTTRFSSQIKRRRRSPWTESTRGENEFCLCKLRNYCHKEIYDLRVALRLFSCVVRIKMEWTILQTLRLCTIIHTNYYPHWHQRQECTFH